MKHNPSFWNDMARKEWVRKKWHRTDPHSSSGKCVACGLPIHRSGTYYVRPAYTDGTLWLCQNCYRYMVEQVEGGPFEKKYGRRK